MHGFARRVALVASCAAFAACSYEEVLPLKDGSDAANVIDISFSDSGDSGVPTPQPDSAIDFDTVDSATPIETSPDSTPGGGETSDVILGNDDDGAESAPDATPDTAADTDEAADTAVEIDTNPPACGDGVCNPGEDCLSCAADCQCPERCGADLFLSEYVEGTSWNKAIEIANFTGRDVDLQGYALWKITNGGDWAEGASHAFRLSGTLAHGAVLVVCHGTSAAPILAACDVVTTVDFAEFNGDDAIALARNGAIIDVIGSDGADPGAGWTVGGVSEATIDHTLRRKVDVLTGFELWTDSEPTWNVLSNDVIGGPGGLGELQVRAHCDASSAPRAALNEIAAAGTAGDGQDFVELAAFSGPGQQGVLDIGGWVVASTSGRYTFPSGSTVAVGGYRALSQGVLGFALGLIDRVWLYDAQGALQDVVGWHAEDLSAGASYGRLPDLTGEFGSNTVATPGAGNRNPETWCGDDICQEDEDCGACPGDCPVCYPGPGDLVISEVMAEPSVGAEWFEIVNVTSLPLELADLVVRDEGVDFHAVMPVPGTASRTIEAGEILVMASGAMTGIAHQYVFSGVALSAGADQVILERDGVVIDGVAWTQSPGRGIAWSLSGGVIDAAANDDAGAWCAAADSYFDGQRATPGSANPVCSECGDGTCDGDESCDACPQDCGACVAEGCAPDLFISEYLEGTSYNKALEIVNRTGAAVDLSHYALWRITNGGSTWAALAASSKVSLTGTLAHGDVWVGCNTSSDEALKAKCDAFYGQGSAPTNFNGDDAVALAKDGVIIDVVGADAIDPGVGWAVAGVAEATANHTLVRKPDVLRGNVVWESSALLEWLVRPEDDLTGLGTHEVDYTCQP